MTAVEANPNELLTEEQTSELVGVTKDTLSVWRCTKRYNLPYLKIGRLVRYKRAHVEEWLESRTIRSGD